MGDFDLNVKLKLKMMKKLCFLLVAALVACEQPMIDPSTGSGNVEVKKIKLRIGGDWSAEQTGWTTRAVTADGKELTDLWVIDCDADGNVLQQLHQSNTEQNFGSPELTLNYGAHKLCVVLSRGSDGVLNTENRSVTWGSPSDTFWQCAQLNVDASTSANQAITAERVATKLAVVVSDAMPADIATVEITPATWYYGLNYLTGAPTAAATSQTRVLQVPASKVGKTGVTLSIFGLSAQTEWTTNVGVTATNQSNAAIASVQLSNVPLAANRVTQVCGTLFGSTRGLQLQVSDAWSEATTIAW